MTQLQTSKQTVICYSSDPGFFQPSLASIASLQRWPSAAGLKIIYLCVGFSDEQKVAAAEILEALGVESHFAAIDELKSFETPEFNKTHYPVTSLARFYLSDYVGDEASDILYVDGDTWFARDPEAFLKFPVPPGSLAAAEDQAFFYQNEVSKHGRFVREYFAGLGVTPDTGYFNAGIIKAGLSDWREISQEALGFLRTNLKACLYHDQSALNAVAKHRRVRLSTAWNFQSAFLDWNCKGLVDPAIYHFVGGRKPWLGDVAEWRFLTRSYFDLTPSVGSHSSLGFKSWNAEEQAQSDQYARSRQLKSNTILLPRKLSRIGKFNKLAKLSELN
ncbi:MAG: hypothetical protein HRT81_05685 [Henriciella sp.]|nr:hypothetical protein [Henriciella sp.]